MEGVSPPPPPAYPGTASQVSVQPTHTEVYEHDRWFPVSGWGGKLLPTDPPRFARPDGAEVKSPPGPAAPPPPGTAWADAAEKWAVSPWEYAVDFPRPLLPYDFAQTMGKTDCVRRRMWRRAVMPAPAAAGTAPTAWPVPPSAGGAAAPREAASATSVACTVAPTAVLAGALSGRWLGGSCAHAVLDDGKLFLLAAAGDTKAALTVPVATISSVLDVHPLEAGAPHAFALNLDPGRVDGVARVDVVAADADTHAQWAKVLRQASRAARPVVGPALRHGAAVAGSTLTQGARLVGGYFAGSFGVGAGWTMGRRVGDRVSNSMGL